MPSSPDEFWNSRYKDEGELWGNRESPTANIAVKYFTPGSQVFEIGFGYGRDLIFLSKNGFGVAGVEPTSEGYQMTLMSLANVGIATHDITCSNFEEANLLSAPFKSVLSHRFLHLLTTRTSIDLFLDKLVSITEAGAIICIGARDLKDLNSEQSIPRGEGIYELKKRPGHLISYWDENRFLSVFSGHFEPILFKQVSERESKETADTCNLTVMVARKF